MTLSHADFLLFSTGHGPHLLLADGSRVYGIDEDLNQELHGLLAEEPELARQLLAARGFFGRPYVDEHALENPPLRALSLSVAQKCNLGCSYCYAQKGSFGGAPKDMSEQVALKSIDLLLDGAEPGTRVNVAYMGGEPFLNRQLIFRTTRYAAERAAEKGVTASFSVTTNATQLTQEDAEFLEQHGFAVTVSVDGTREVHNLLRPFKGGQPSHDVVMRNARMLLGLSRRMQVSARVTLTRKNLQLKKTLDALMAEGFSSVGFSPVLRSPSAADQLTDSDFTDVLGQMQSCGEEFKARLVKGETYPFSNMIQAMEQIHRGTHRPYPCGAGASYLSVSAEGELSACHRFVGDEQGAMGSVHNGVDAALQREWLSERHVDRQEPCRSCWARYLCGGGCHHEVLSSGRPACDFIRGWLEYCLRAYVELAEVRPDYFARMAAAFAK